MSDYIAALQGTPIPTILVICGIILLLLAAVAHVSQAVVAHVSQAAVAQFTRYVAIPPRARIWSGAVGGCLLVVGVLLLVLEPEVTEPVVSEPEVLKPIPIAVDSYSSNKNVAVGVLPELYGDGVLSPKKNYSVGDSWVEYEFHVERSSTYALWIRYASEESRPVRIKLNGEVINDKGLSGTMAGWEDPEWALQGSFELEPGDYVLRLEREGPFENAYMPFPAIHGIEFRPPDSEDSN